MHDVLDIIKNIQNLYAVGPTLGILKDFERIKKNVSGILKDIERILDHLK